MVTDAVVFLVPQNHNKIYFLKVQEKRGQYRIIYHQGFNLDYKVISYFKKK